MSFSTMDYAFSLNGAPYTTLPPVLSVATAVTMGVSATAATLFPHISMLECVAAGAPLGLTLSTWITIILKSVAFAHMDGLPSTIALTGALIQLLATLFFFRKARAEWDHRRSAFARASFAAVRFPLLVLTIGAVWFGYLHYTHSLLRQGDNWFVGGTVYGDLPFHLNVITSLLWGPNKNAAPLFENMNATFYMDANLVYPYVPDYHAAALVGAGSSFHFSLFVPGVILCACFLYLLFALNVRLTGSVMAGLIAVPLCVFAGGVGGWIWAIRDGSWAGIMSKDHVQYVVGSNNQEVYWFSLVAHILFPQRTTQFAYTISIAALIMAYRALESHGSTNFDQPTDQLSSPAQNPPGTPVGDGPSGTPTRNGSRNDPFMTPEAEQNRRRRRRGSSPNITTPRMLEATPEAGKTPKPKLTGALAAMPLDVMWMNSGATARTRLLIGAGVFTGLLPLLQAHSFVAVGVIMIVVALMEVVQLGLASVFFKKESRSPVSSAGMSRGGKKPSTLPWNDLKMALRTWITYGVVAFAIGLPQSTIYFAKAAGGQMVTHPDGRITPFVRLVPLWHDQRESGGADPFTLWWKSLLFFVPLNFLGVFMNPFTTVQRRFQLGMLAVFVMSNFVIFQPWELDNTKVFYVWLFGASGCVALVLRRLYNAGAMLSRSHSMGAVGTLMKAASVFAGCALCLTGFLCLVNETYSFVPMFDSIDVEQAVWINENTPTDARFVTSTHGTHFRPASSLGGRSLLTTYVGWVSNHGMPGWIQRNERQNHLQEGVNKHNAWRTILDYDLTHMVMQQSEIKRWDVNFLNSYAYRVASNGRSIVYKFAPRAAFENVQDCAPGATDINEETCGSKGCVWVPGFQGPWCQVRPTVAQYNAIGWEGAPEATDCSHKVGNEESCNVHACSWFHGYDGPWCHEALSVPGAAKHGRGGMRVLMTDPVDCGGHSELMCADRGCNWLPRPGMPWCTKPKEGDAPSNPHTSEE